MFENGLVVTLDRSIIVYILVRVIQNTSDYSGKIIVEAVETYGYSSKIMFSFVRYPEHVRNALNIGVHVSTIPWKVMKKLTSNHFTEVGISQFVEHTKLMTVKIKDELSGKNPVVKLSDSITDTLVKMTSSGFGFQRCSRC